MGDVVEEAQYPNLYQVTDSAAVRTQRAHFRVLRAEIALLVATAGVASLAWDRVLSTTSPPATATAIILVILIGLGFLRYARRYDRAWFSCRSVAESVKLETWRYMMKADSYASPDDPSADRHFLGQIRSIMDGLPPEAKGQLGSEPLTGTQITDFMRAVRHKSLAERLALYRQSRVRDQRTWYASKAGWNARRESWWFSLTILLQIAAASIAVWIVATPGFIFNPVGLATTLAASGGTWNNARGYRELAQSYGMVSQELGILEDEAAQITNETEFVAWVSEVERTISREHTMWVRRRTP